MIRGFIICLAWCLLGVYAAIVIGHAIRMKCARKVDFNCSACKNRFCSFKDCEQEREGKGL